MLHYSRKSFYFILLSYSEYSSNDYMGPLGRHLNVMIESHQMKFKMIFVIVILQTERAFSGRTNNENIYGKGVP